ncbi:Ig-like domain-containing protein, partial [Chitinophaga arvensicola]
MNYIKRLLLSLLLLLGSIHTQAENNPVTGNKAPVSVPTVYISGQRGTDGSTFVVTFNFSEAVTGFDATAVSMSGWTNLTATNPTGGPKVYTMTVACPANTVATLNVTLLANKVKSAGGQLNSQSFNATFTIDNVQPVVEAVIAPYARNYRTGDEIHFRVFFSKQVFASVAGQVPGLPITVGSRQTEALFSGGIGDNSLFFSYKVQSGDRDLNGVEVGTSLNIPPHSLNDTYGNELLPTLAGIENTSEVLVNATSPACSVTQLSGGSQVNGPFQVRVSFTEAVTGFTAASMALTNATVTSFAAEDQFNYLLTIKPDGDGAVSVYVPADVAMNDGPNGNLISNQIDVTADVTIPTITQLDVPAPGKYGTSNTLEFTVHFSENVNVNTRNGVPTLKLNIGGTVVDADFMGISGTDTWSFSYQIKDGDMDLDGIELGAGISLNGATIRDGARNNANVTFPGTVDVSGIKISTVRPTVVLSSTAPEWVNNPITVYADFSEAVTGITTASFQVYRMIVDEVTTTDNIHFVLTVSPTFNGPLSITLPADQGLNQYSTGNTASDPLTRTGDFLDPKLLTLDVPSNGAYGINSTLTFTAHYNEIVLVNTTNGTPYMAINSGINGGTTKVLRALYSGGSGTDAISFTYTVQEGDADPDGISLGAGISFGGGGLMTDRAGNIARLVLPANNVSGITINTTRPTVTLSTTAPAILKDPFTVTAVFSEVVNGLTAAAFTLVNATASNLQTSDYITYTMTITPSADGAVSILLPANIVHSTLQNGNIASNQVSVTADLTAPTITSVDLPVDRYYNAGEKLTFVAHFSENVVINASNGAYSLPVVISGGNVSAGYTGVFTANTMTFSYTIQDGDMAMNGLSFGTALSGTGSETIRDPYGNDAVLTLPANMDGSHIFINTVSPGVTLSTGAGGLVDRAFTITITFTEKVFGFTTGDFLLTNATISTLQSSDDITYTALITPIASGPVAVSVPANVATNIGRNGNTAAPAAVNVSADLAIPAVTQVAVPADGYYNATRSLNFTVTYNKVVTVVGVPSLRVTVGAKNADAVYTGGSGTNTLTFAYAIQPGDNDMNGIVLAANMELNSGTIKDRWGKDALLPLNNVASTANVFVNTQHPSVSLSTAAAATVGKPFTVTAVFSEVVTGLTASAFTLQNATASTLQSADGITYTVLITPAATGAVTVSLPA